MYKKHLFFLVALYLNPAFASMQSANTLTSSIEQSPEDTATTQPKKINTLRKALNILPYAAGGLAALEPLFRKPFPLHNAGLRVSSEEPSQNDSNPVVAAVSSEDKNQNIYVISEYGRDTTEAINNFAKIQLADIKGGYCYYSWAMNRSISKVRRNNGMNKKKGCANVAAICVDRFNIHISDVIAGQDPCRTFLVSTKKDKFNPRRYHYEEIQQNKGRIIPRSSEQLCLLMTSSSLYASIANLDQDAIVDMVMNGNPDQAADQYLQKALAKVRSENGAIFCIPLTKTN